MKERIAALWASAMMCYIYGDIIALLVPGHLQGVLEGRLGIWTTLLIAWYALKRLPVAEAL